MPTLGEAMTIGSLFHGPGGTVWMVGYAGGNVVVEMGSEADLTPQQWPGGGTQKTVTSAESQQPSGVVADDGALIVALTKDGTLQTWRCRALDRAFELIVEG